MTWGSHNLFNWWTWVDLSTKMSDWLPYEFIWEKYWKVSFSKTLEDWWSTFGIVFYWPRRWKYVNVKDNGWTLTLFQGHIGSHFQTTFSLKTRGKLQPYFRFSLQGLEEQNYLNESGLLAKIAAFSIYGRKPLKIFYKNMEIRQCQWGNLWPLFLGHINPHFQTISLLKPLGQL